MGIINQAKQVGDAMLHTAKETGKGIGTGIAIGVALLPVFIILSVIDHK